MSDSTPALIAALKKSIEDFVVKVTDKLKGFVTTQVYNEGINARPTTQAMNTALTNATKDLATKQSVTDATKDLATKQALSEGLAARPTTQAMNVAIQQGIGSRPTSEQISMFVVADHAPTQAEINNLPDGAVWFQTGA
ncbi:hypothetical protein Xoosp14_143 [Xanthomonas phage Xoo-sp14]|nr:hypothetical protein Xoosp14_143 [Xanthomonas phage Xoo-sp14]